MPFPAMVLGPKEPQQLHPWPLPWFVVLTFFSKPGFRRLVEKEHYHCARVPDPTQIGFKETKPLKLTHTELSKTRLLWLSFIVVSSLVFSSLVHARGQDQIPYTKKNA
jgi:hypothetical protein